MKNTDSNTTLNLFISYSHVDMSIVEKLVKHLRPLEQNNAVSVWWDRCNHPGSTFLPTIDKNLENSDVILLCLSSNYLVSEACIKEAKVALSLRDSGFVSVIPVILSECAWTDFDSPRLSHLLALPKDGHAVATYTAESSAFQEIYISLRDTFKTESLIRNPKLKLSFEEDLHAFGMLGKINQGKLVWQRSFSSIYWEQNYFQSLFDHEMGTSKELVNNCFQDHFLNNILIAP